MRGTLDGDGIIGIESGSVLASKEWSLGLWTSFAHDPLVAYQLDTGKRVGALVNNRWGAGLVGSIGLLGWAEIGLELPVVLHQNRDASVANLTTEPLPPLASMGLGDLRIAPKVSILGRNAPVELAAMVSITLPTGGSANYFGDSSVTVEPELALMKSWRALRLGANLGVQLRRDQSLANQLVQSEVLAGFGAGYRFAERGGPPLELDASVSGAFSAKQPFANTNQDPLEARGQVGWAFHSGVSVFVGGGAGLISGWGTPDWRVFGGLRFTPQQAQPAPESAPAPLPPPPPAPKPAPPPSPPPPAPKPEQPKPEADDDGDGLPNSADRCPTKAGPKENHGCPDTDRDGDGVVDRLENCPEEAGSAENGGCKAKQLAVLKAGRIEILESVYFKTNKDIIEKRSFKLLQNVARVLKAHPEITRVEVEGHTDSQGNAKHNLDLSSRRAQAVVRFLVKEGLDAGRLAARGYGQTRPIASNKTASGREKNRRVVFTIPDSPSSVKTDASTK